MNKVLFFAQSHLERIEYKTINQIYEIRRGGFAADFFLHTSQLSFKNVVSLARFLFSSDVVVVSSPLLRVFPIVVMARLFSKKVVGIVWDVYPVKIGGSRFNPSLLRVIGDYFENIALSFLNAKFIPTKDFALDDRLKEAIVLRFWPQFAIVNTGAVCRFQNPSIRIAYCGQINATRGLDAAYSRRASR